MILTPQPPIGVDVDRGWIEVSADLLQRYQRAIALATARPIAAPPASLGLFLALRGEPFPTLELDDATLSVHGGHTLRALEPLQIPGRYRVIGRLDDVFSKNGRSGPLTVIARSALVVDPQGTPVVSLQDQQIVRWRPSAAPPPSSVSLSGAPADDRLGDAPPVAPTDNQLGDAPTPHVVSPAGHVPEPGDVIAVEHRAAPDAAGVRRYAQWLGPGEPLFVDPIAARRLGFADVIVPGPLQSALVENLLARALPNWQLQVISCTFRISLGAGEPIALAVVATEVQDTTDVRTMQVDITIENVHGERAAVGSATQSRRQTVA